MYNSIQYCNTVQKRVAECETLFVTAMTVTAMSHRKRCQTCGKQRLQKCFLITGISCMSCLCMYLREGCQNYAGGFTYQENKEKGVQESVGYAAFV